MIRSLNFFLVDTFSDKFFQGNPTPVCIVDFSTDFAGMSSLAKEFLSPVTVFISKLESVNTYHIRYFTITGEIPACGHGTLGAAHVLFQYFNIEKEVYFITTEGVELCAEIENDKVFVEYPRYVSSPYTPSIELTSALEIETTKSVFYCSELESVFIELSEEELVRNMKPDFEKLLGASNQIKEVVVMCKSNSDRYDFILRSFCPWIGIDEDPVTGSVHSVLGHYWGEKLDKKILIAYQDSERGGEVIIKPLLNSVKIGGAAKILVEGNLKR